MNDAPKDEVAGKDIAQFVPQRTSIHICRSRGLGDVLMCTPALRELKRINPHRRIHFYTDLPDLVQGLSYIDNVSLTATRPPQSIWIGYRKSIPSYKHLAEIMGESIGVRVNDVRPDCIVVEKLVEYYKIAWQNLPHPHVLVQRRASAWTPNKNWPSNHWDELILSLLKTHTIIEIGHSNLDHTIFSLPNYIDLRGKTDLKALIACVAAADILVAPDSGPIHIAAAVRTPTVLIMGGYILPENTAYPENKVLYTPIYCSPCWLRTACPIDRECLKKIAPETVEQAITDIWKKKQKLSPFKPV